MENKEECDNCLEVKGFYLGMTCPKCLRPFRNITGNYGYTVATNTTKPLEETWTKTMDLRSGGFVTNYRLQQKHISNLGNEKWCDIETVII